MAKLAKQRFGASVKESSSLVGRKNGQDLYRVTFCLRFPHGENEAVASGPSGPSGRALEQ